MQGNPETLTQSQMPDVVKPATLAFERILRSATRETFRSPISRKTANKMSFFSILWSILREIIKVVYGLLFLLSFPIYLLVCTPIFIYRWGLSLWAKWFCKGKVGKLVTAHGSSFATEFIPSTHILPTRYAICLQVVVDGKVTADELETSIKAKWLHDNSPYPELKQYVEYWMGYMVWKPDLHFNLHNHIKTHPIEGKTDAEVEQNTCTLVEELLNKPFPFKRSPWECYIAPNYRNEQLKADCVNGEMTLLVLRFHHCLADGFSILSAIMEGLFEIPLTELELPNPTKLMGLTSFGKKLKFALTCLPRGLMDLANFTTLPYSPRTPLHSSEQLRGCKLIYERSELMPIQRIKDIKNKLGVSFTSVLLTTISAAIAKSLHSLQGRNGGVQKSVEMTPFGIALPLPGHTKKLRNHWTGTFLELPTKLELGTMERLKKVGKVLKQARTSLRPLFFPILWKSMGLPLAGMSKSLGKNRFAPAALSSFPGPAIDVYLNGKKVLLADALGGLLDGVAGVGFLLLTFRNHIRIATMVVDGVMDRGEVKEMLGYVQDELDSLYDLTMKSEFVKDEKTLLPV